MSRTSQAWTSPSFPDIAVFATDQVPALECERMAGAVGRLLTRLEVTGGARIRITGADRAAGPLLIQVNLTVSGRPARLQTRTRGPGDALSVLQRLERLASALSVPWHPRPWPDPTHRILATPGPGRLTRRKSFPLTTRTPLTAAAFMDTMDYDAHLFTDAGTGTDAIVYRAGPDGLRLVCQQGAQPRAASANGSESLTADSRPAPALTDSQAAQQVCERGLPFLFYTGADDGRGRLLYRRYDRDLALIDPPRGQRTTSSAR